MVGARMKLVQLGTPL